MRGTTSTPTYLLTEVPEIEGKSRLWIRFRPHSPPRSQGDSSLKGRLSSEGYAPSLPNRINSCCRSTATLFPKPGAGNGDWNRLSILLRRHEREETPKQNPKHQNSTIPTAAGLIKQETKSVGAAAVGGPFSLIDHNGKRFNSDNLKDEFSLLYFGFTQCPDVCPEELDKITEAVKQISSPRL